MADLSPAARERAQRTVSVADVFAAHAQEIAVAVELLPAKHVLVAIVDSENEFRGTHQVDETDLIERVKELEGPDGWAMVFSAGAHPEHVRTRTGEMASIAQKRADAIDRITARQTQSGDA